MNQGDFNKLRDCIVSYENDPKHTITPAHISHRQHCVITYGGDATQTAIRQIYEEYYRDTSVPGMLSSRGSVRTEGQPKHKGGGLPRVCHSKRRTAGRQIPRCRRH